MDVGHLCPLLIWVIHNPGLSISFPVPPSFLSRLIVEYIPFFSPPIDLHWSHCTTGCCRCRRSPAIRRWADLCRWDSCGWKIAPARRPTYAAGCQARPCQPHCTAQSCICRYVQSDWEDLAFLFSSLHPGSLRVRNPKPPSQNSCISIFIVSVNADVIAPSSWLLSFFFLAFWML